MAPSPEYDKEPKAPDKSAANISIIETKAPHSLLNDQQTISENKSSNTNTSVEVENNKNVEHLDDGQLKALLDEAITYKCPKDREGKSSLFNELLEEVEQDEQALEAARGAGAGAARARRGAGRSRRALPHSNSLQNLEQEALAAECALRRVRNHAPVSVRAGHGGSLPSDVDKSFLVGEEPRAGYLATVRCVNPPPLAERRVSASDANGPAELELLNRRSKPPFQMTYTARATLEISGSSVSSGRAVTTTTASNQVDSAIPFNCITTSEVADSAAAAAAPPAAADDTKPRGATFNGLPLPRAIYGSTAAAAPEEFKKSLDENGNSLQGLSSPLSGTSQFKKPRRKKSSKNETVMTSEEIDGYKGDKDLNEVLRFIESAAGGARAPKLPHRKHAHDDDKGKKRSAERRKDKEPELKRASSLEELSRTTLEELTDEPRRRERDGPGRERDGGAAPAKPERRSWGDDARDYYAEPAADAGAMAATGGGFQTVTKKRRPRRRDERDEPRARAPEPRPRRVSAPPSDRSGDSNDDLDSVHSLPALAPRGAPAVAPAAPPAPAAPAPAPAAVSYADIARTRHNIPDLIESCNFYAEGPVPAEPPPTVVDVDTYPALEPRRPPRAASAAAAAVGKPATDPPRTQEPPRRKERCSSLAESVVVAESPPPPAPDVVADRRPPVILLDSASRPKDMDGITFGFDINEQLLGGPAPRPRCDLVRDALEVWDGGDSGGGGSVAPAEGSVAVVAGCAALRYVPPEPPADTHHLLQIVDYVGSAWEDVVRCGSGKVRYFSE